MHYEKCELPLCHFLAVCLVTSEFLNSAHARLLQNRKLTFRDLQLLQLSSLTWDKIDKVSPCHGGNHQTGAAAQPLGTPMNTDSWHAPPQPAQHAHAHLWSGAAKPARPVVSIPDSELPKQLKPDAEHLDTATPALLLTVAPSSWSRKHCLAGLPIDQVPVSMLARVGSVSIRHASTIPRTTHGSNFHAHGS